MVLHEEITVLSSIVKIHYLETNGVFTPSDLSSSTTLPFLYSSSFKSFVSLSLLFVLMLSTEDNEPNHYDDGETSCLMREK
jgi:hypothetical protein